MYTILNITNGDAAADRIKASYIQGDVLPWRDPMQYGPWQQNLDLDSLNRIRADFLAEDSGNYDEIIRDFRLRNQHLNAADKYEEVVLWFEYDLLDQLQLLQLLDWFSRFEVCPAKLSIICINDFPGIGPFRGLGQLDSEQIASLFPGRSIVTEKQLALVKEGWDTFCSTNPENLLAFTKSPLEPLPYLGAALHRHLEEFPWVEDGLSKTERQILQLIDSGVGSPLEVFDQNMQMETVFFPGDWATYKRIAFLCANGLINCKPGNDFLYPPNSIIENEEFNKQALSLSETGRNILSGDVHATQVIKRDEWLGGVHLKSGHSLWLWDAREKVFVKE